MTTGIFNSTKILESIIQPGRLSLATLTLHHSIITIYVLKQQNHDLNNKYLQFVHQFNHRQHRKSLPHDYKSVVATLPPIPGQVLPSATGERRRVSKTIDERGGYPDEESEEAGREFNTVGGTTLTLET